MNEVLKMVKNYMRIRVLSPDTIKWKAIAKEGNKYYIKRKNARNATRFVTLDVGHAGGLMFIRGVPNIEKLKVGDVVKSSNFKTQSIRLEYKSIGVNEETKQQTVIKKFNESPYKNWVFNFLSREYPKLKDIEVKEKGTDYMVKLVF